MQTGNAIERQRLARERRSSVLSHAERCPKILHSPAQAFAALAVEFILWNSETEIPMWQPK